MAHIMTVNQKAACTQRRWSSLVSFKIVGKYQKYSFLRLTRKISKGETGYVKYRGTL